MTVHVSNLGKINIPRSYGKLKIKELYFSTGQHIIGSCFWLGVVTFQEKLFCTFAHVSPLISDRTAESFANYFINVLYQACLPNNFTLREC
ncbi:MAG: condensation protein, partial [Cyanobacteria bacterium J06639_18]